MDIGEIGQSTRGKTWSKSVDKGKWTAKPVCLGLKSPSQTIAQGLIMASISIPGGFVVLGVSPLGCPIEQSPQQSAHHCVGDTSSTLCHLNLILIPRGSLRIDVHWTEEESGAQRG